MNIDEQLESFVNEFEPKRRLEILHWFIQTVGRIIEDYMKETTAIDALESAIEDQENFDRNYGADRLSMLVDMFVLARLRYKTPH
jgi:hypothetical protein